MITERRGGLWMTWHWLSGSLRPEHHPKLSTKSYAYEGFNYAVQLKSLFLRSLLRLFLTIALALITVAILWAYSSHEAISSSQRQQFNALLIGVSIALGLSTSSSLKSNVSELRWWLLSLGEASPRETDLILQSEELGQLAQLGYTTRRFRVRVYVILWVCFFLISQVAVALLGLTYNADDSTKLMVTKPGIVSIRNSPEVDFGSDFRVLSETQATIAKRSIANRFGSMMTTSRMQYHSVEVPIEKALPKPGSNIDERYYPIYCEKETSTCRYVFQEKSTGESDFSARVATRRHVAASTSCQSWKVSSGGDGLQSLITIADSSNTTFGPLPALDGPDQALFMFDPEDPRASGDTWALISVLEASEKRPWFYVCNATLDPVVNAVLKEHQLGAIVPKLATQAIALQAYGSSAMGLANGTRRLQFQSYPRYNLFGQRLHGNTTEMGNSISAFCLGALGGLVMKAPTIDVPGMEPVRSARIQVLSWQNVYLVLGFTVCFQAVLAAISVTISNRVQVHTRSHFAMANLLRPALQDLDIGTSLPDGKQIAKLMGPKVRLSYKSNDLGGCSIVKATE